MLHGVFLFCFLLRISHEIQQIRLDTLIAIAIHMYFVCKAMNIPFFSGIPVVLVEMPK